jgi:four helix bundle protein
MGDHRKLEAFRLADQLVLQVYSFTNSLPRNEQFGLTSQMRRASVSIPTNIVEGSARRSLREYIRFLEIAFGSARELGYLLDLTVRLEYVDTRSATDVRNLQARTAAALSALINSLIR